jgi:deazaflavin-dependent oxidoreductase (nitroreductase family)
MNGWGEGHPNWWLNLLASPTATVRLADGSDRHVRAREAVGAERARLWPRWVAADPKLTAPAASRATPTPVVVLEPS